VRIIELQKKRKAIGTGSGKKPFAQIDPTLEIPSLKGSMDIKRPEKIEIT